MSTKIVSQEEWLIARKELLAKEKAHMRAGDALAAQRRDLGMVKVGKEYVFEGPNGKASLLDLFDGRKQLLVYHFMFGPEDTAGCPGCSLTADHIPHLSHLQSRNTSLVVISRTSVEKIEAYRKRMDWTFPWYSSLGSDFNYDYHVSIDEDVAPVMLNYRTGDELVDKNGKKRGAKGECPAWSVFFNDGGELFHTYSTFERGTDQFGGTSALLDVTPLGRQDEGPEFERHDEY